jgi:cyanophycin synthetase
LRAQRGHSGVKASLQAGAVVEVNAGPGLLMHLRPAEGSPQPVGGAIVDHLFPPGDAGRIPIVGIAGHRGTTAVARRVAHLLRATGKRLGVATRDGMTVGTRTIRAEDSTGWEAARGLLMNRTVEAAVFENPPRMMAEEGLAYDRCLVGVVTSLDHEAAFDDLCIEAGDPMWGVLRTHVDVVLPEGTAVLNGDDEQVADMGRLCDGHVILYGRDGAAPAIVAHRGTGRRAVFARGRDLVLADSREEIVLAGLMSAGDPDALLPAAAVAWALSFSPEGIRAGIESYHAADATRVRAVHVSHAASN